MIICDSGAVDNHMPNNILQALQLVQKQLMPKQPRYKDLVELNEQELRVDEQEHQASAVQSNETTGHPVDCWSDSSGLEDVHIQVKAEVYA